jgi:hypothetical protein
LLVAVLAAAFLFGGLAVSTASATTVDDCQSQLATLRADTVAAESSFTNEQSVTSALGKLDAASTKLAEGKNADAVQKLVDYQTLLNALVTAPKPKLDPASAEAPIAEAQGVIDCINGIGSTA